MDFFERLPEDVIGEIVSNAEDEKEDIHFAITIPKAKKFYNDKRKDPEYWLQRLEFEFSYKVPKEYIEDVAVLERFHTLLRSAVSSFAPIFEISQCRYLFDSILPEMFILISTMNNDEDNVPSYVLFEYLVVLFAEASFENNPALIECLYELPSGRRNELIVTILTRISTCIRQTCHIENFKIFLTITQKYYADVVTQYYTNNKITVQFDKYELIFKTQQILKELGIGHIFVIEKERIPFNKTSMTKYDDYIPSLSIFLSELFVKEVKEKDYDIYDDKTITLNQLLYLMLAFKWPMRIGKNGYYRLDDALNKLEFSDNVLKQLIKVYSHLSDKVKIKLRKVLQDSTSELALKLIAILGVAKKSNNKK